MAKILCLETATHTCSVALAIDGQAVAVRHDHSATYSHAEKLHVFVDEVMQGYKWAALDAISFSAGPGSYTGLRIATSAAKGFAFALDIPLIAVNSLESLASAAGVADGLLIAMIDARRMEVYAAGYADGLEVFANRAEVLSTDSFPEAAGYTKIYFFGDGAEKARDLFEPQGWKFIPDVRASAMGQIALAEKAFGAGSFADTASVEPIYLKDVAAAQRKVG